MAPPDCQDIDRRLRNTGERCRWRILRAMSILQGNPEAAKIGVEQPPDNPLVLLRDWIDQAASLNVTDHQALVLGTLRTDGRPQARVVSAKSCDEAGVIFGTSTRSGKGLDLAHCPHASGVFWWPSLMQQVTMTGSVNVLPSEKSDELFAGRPREAQAVAILSHQSQPLVDEADLREGVQNLLSGREPLNRPSHWHGFRLVIDSIEFWHGRVDRLHRRLHYSRVESEQTAWRMRRLQP